MKLRGWLVTGLVVCIVLAHVALWRSGMDTSTKLAFTVLNAIGWTIVLAPILLVDKWLDAKRGHNQDRD
ncbi:phenylalanyl-tRNA synthetase subunit beta [Thalassobacter stenotrophicus]|uniref:phenylalanyl-tRNA synthetase subunit beta n=1 Tax=Thalassobacter stenotrophicus TaxID=266809 RepID=UPI0022A92D8C|nr:phenylalanyl-tRNA synthetase subunit beta [Thalassobacter stenotrophicus]UYP67117.1 phenylalanyl-tRNA synthetase subunit beta [Thalassobacter stenotrophicus]